MDEFSTIPLRSVVRLSPSGPVMNDAIQERHAKLTAWLKENVVVPKIPAEISVFDIEFDWGRLSRQFSLALDGETLEDRFHLLMEITGRVIYHPPMFCSPMGVPASYAAVKLDVKIDQAIQRALDSRFSKVRTYGWHEDIDLIIDATTPFKDRIIDQDEFDAKRQLIEAGHLKVSASVEASGL
jgi:hypothetical protein